jgi:hypothetical protein
VKGEKVQKLELGSTLRTLRRLVTSRRLLKESGYYPSVAQIFNNQQHQQQQQSMAGPSPTLPAAAAAATATATTTSQLQVQTQAQPALQQSQQQQQNFRNALGNFCI